MSQTTTPTPLTPQGNVPAINIPDVQDYPRLIFTAPYFEQVALAELFQPAVIEAAESVLPGLVEPYVNAAAIQAVQNLAVLISGSTMTGPLFLSPLYPTQPSQAVTMAYVDAMLATAGIPEVPPVPVGQAWARETGQWVPIAGTGGDALPLSGGTMSGIINMNGNAINNLAAVPNLPNGAAPASWVMTQIAALSLYQGTWTPETNTPDLTQSSAQQNDFTWIVVTSNTNGVVVTAAIPGLQGATVYNGDDVIYSTTVGAFQVVRGGALTYAEATALFIPLTGGQMTGAPLLLSANATQPLQAVPLQQVQSLIAAITASEITVTPPLLGQTNLQALLTSLTALATAQMETFTQDANGNVSPALLPNATVIISGDMNGLATDTTGTADSVGFSGDATTT